VQGDNSLAKLSVNSKKVSYASILEPFKGVESLQCRTSGSFEHPMFSTYQNGREDTSYYYRSDSGFPVSDTINVDKRRSDVPASNNFIW